MTERAKELLEDLKTLTNKVLLDLVAENEDLEEQFDSIKAEIDKAQEPYMTSTDYDEGVRFGLMLAYQIVDKAEKGGE